jgi:recombination DNA repair RAD52 pathway protein
MLNDAQYAQLLKPLNPSRVAKRSQAGRNLSYLEAWDVKAHLNRIFGFGSWSADVLSAELAFEEKNEKGQWNVGYKVVLRLTLHGIHSTVNQRHEVTDHDATYTEAAVGSASLPQRGEAHDMAVKTAESDALKRAAINLGTQFGLSLYDNGSTKDVIGKTLDRDTVSQPEGEPEPPVTEKSDAIPDSDGADHWIGQMKTAIDAKDVASLLTIKQDMTKAKVAENVYQGVTLAKWLDKAIATVGKK